MGEVWRAEQTAPVRRPVAVEFVKAGMDSRQVLARFDAERQALARMDHPNVARVLDGGLHDGRPYFVMELVNGVPIPGGGLSVCRLDSRGRHRCPLKGSNSWWWPISVSPSPGTAPGPT